MDIWTPYTMQWNNFKTGLVSHSYNSYDQWFIVSLLFLAHVIGHSCWLTYKMEHGWLWATYNLCHREALSSVVVKSVFSRLQHCMLLYDTSANNSINSDERSRPHSYSVQQQSPVSSQWACELMQQVQKIPYPSTKCHYVTYDGRVECYECNKDYWVIF